MRDVCLTQTHSLKGQSFIVHNTLSLKLLNICTMPLIMMRGWNEIQFNLTDFTNRAYVTNYVETWQV